MTRKSVRIIQSNNIYKKKNVTEKKKNQISNIREKYIYGKCRFIKALSFK